MPSQITRFRGAYRFLSNFFPSRVELDGVAYPTVEHAYQAAKTLDPQIRAGFVNLEGPSEAKHLGRRVPLRADWEQVKETVMHDLLRQKFADEHLKRLLLSTGDAELIEGNDWGDRYWGVCRGEGLNRLGVLLTAVRREYRSSL